MSLSKPIFQIFYMKTISLSHISTQLSPLRFYVLNMNIMLFCRRLFPFPAFSTWQNYTLFIIYPAFSMITTLVNCNYSVSFQFIITSSSICECDTLFMNFFSEEFMTCWLISTFNTFKTHPLLINISSFSCTHNSDPHRLVVVTM